MEVRNNYTDENNYTHIDFWLTDDDNEEGQTVAIVCNDTQKVFFIDNKFRNDKLVQESINEVLQDLIKANEDKARERLNRMIQ